MLSYTNFRHNIDYIFTHNIVLIIYLVLIMMTKNVLQHEVFAAILTVEYYTVLITTVHKIRYGLWMTPSNY